MAADKEEIVGLDEEVDEITLISKDKVSVKMDRKSAFISKLVKTGVEGDASAKSFPLHLVNSDVLSLITKYMEHHKGVEPPLIEKPLRSKKMEEVCKDKWDATYIDEIGEDRKKLYDLILAANYMDITGLLHLGCAKVASLIKGQPLEKIKEILDPKGEYGGEEKKE